MSKKTPNSFLYFVVLVFFFTNCPTIFLQAQPEPTVFKTIEQDIDFDIQLQDAVLDPNPNLSNTRQEILRCLGEDIEQQQSGNLGFTILLSIIENIIGIDIPDSVDDFLAEIAGFATTISPPAEISVDVPVVAEGSAGISLDLEMDYGGYIEIGDIGTANVDIQYPLTVNITAPEDEHFGCGDKITVSTSCDLGDNAVMNITPGFYQTELGPILGDLTLGLDIGAELYLGDCDLSIDDVNFCTKIFDVSEPLLDVQTVNVPDIPPFIVICEDVFRDDANLFDLTECAAGDFIFGDIIDLLVDAGLDLDPLAIADFSDCEVSIQSPDIPSAAQIDLPEFQGTFKKVKPSDLSFSSNGKTISVSGDIEDFSKLSLDLLSFLDYFGLPTSFSAGNGAGIDLGDINLELFTDLDLSYVFNPTFNADFDLGTPMEWEVRDPSAGNALINSSNGPEQIVPNVMIGHDIIVYWPDDLNTEVTVNETVKGSGGLTTESSVQYRNGISLNILEISLPPIIDLKLFEDVELVDTELEDPGIIEDHTIDLTAQIPSSSTSFSLNPDDIPPVLTPIDATVELDANGAGSIVAADVVDLANSFDLPTEGTGELEIVSMIPNTFSCDDLGAVTVTITATDGNCNETIETTTVTVEDNLAPTFTVPADITIDCALDLEDLSVTGDVTDAADNCTVTDVSFSDVSDVTTCGGGTAVRTWTVTDQSGNATVKVQTIIVTEPPEITITCPADQVVTCFEDIDADPNNLTIDNPCGISFATYVKQPLITGGIPGCNGTVYTYIYKMVDECGRKASCEQQFIIQNEAPVVTVPADQTVMCFEDIEVSVDDVTVDAQCEGDVTINVLPPDINGAFNCPGTTYTYTYRVKDFCNRIVEVDRTFTIGNNDAPSIIAPVDYTVTCQASVNPDNAIVTTACGNGLDYEVNVSGPQYIGTPGCNGTQMVYTYTVTDACGRTASDQQVLTIQNEGPQLSCPNDLQLNSCDGGSYIDIIDAWIASVTATSPCNGALEVSNNFNPNNMNHCYWNTFTPITFSAIDECGQQVSCTANIILLDNDAPVLYNRAEDQYQICNANTAASFQIWINENGNALAVDDCAGDNINWYTIPTNPTFNCSQEQMTTVTFCVEDPCGNSTCTTASFYAFQASNNEVETDNEKLAHFDAALPILEVAQNHPNPFMQSTTINFLLPETSLVNLKIFDLSGKLLYNIENEYSSGKNQIDIHQADLQSAGVLYYQLSDGKTTVTKKMILIN